MSEFFYKAAGALLAPFRYAEREVDHMKEVAKEDLQALLAAIIKYTILGIAGLLFLLFISIMTAALINRNMESEFAGYAFVAGFYLLVAIVVFISKQADDRNRKEEDNSGKTISA